MTTLEKHLQDLYDTIAELQGQAIADSTMLEAMLMAHPNPNALRDCWNRLSSPRVAAASVDGAVTNRHADRAELFHLAQWREKVERYHPSHE